MTSQDERTRIVRLERVIWQCPKGSKSGQPFDIVAAGVYGTPKGDEIETSFVETRFQCGGALLGILIEPRYAVVPHNTAVRIIIDAKVVFEDSCGRILPTAIQFNAGARVQILVVPDSDKLRSIQVELLGLERSVDLL
jgi:hypothetical protein